MHKLDGTSFVCCDKTICDRILGNPVVFDLRACPQLADKEREACALAQANVSLIWDTSCRDDIPVMVCGRHLVLSTVTLSCWPLIGRCRLCLPTARTSNGGMVFESLIHMCASLRARIDNWYSPHIHTASSTKRLSPHTSPGATGMCQCFEKGRLRMRPCMMMRVRYYSGVVTVALLVADR